MNFTRDIIGRELVCKKTHDVKFGDAIVFRGETGFVESVFMDCDMSVLAISVRQRSLCLYVPSVFVVSHWDLVP